MEQEVKQSHLPDSSLIDLITQQLQFPSKERADKLRYISPQHYLAIIQNQNQSQNIKVAACSGLKLTVSNRPVFAPIYMTILRILEDMFTNLSVSFKLRDALQFVIQAIFLQYFDDAQKINWLETIMDKILANTKLQHTLINNQLIKFPAMLIRSMNASSLNNEICIGGLIFYMKSVFLPKYQKQEGILGRGLQILSQIINRPDNQPRQEDNYLIAFLQINLQIVQMIHEIIDRVEEEDLEDPTLIPIDYIRNSKQIQLLFKSIICRHEGGKIYTRIKKVNELKAEILELYVQIYLDYIDKSFLGCCFNTIATLQLNEIADESESIIIFILKLLQRAVSNPDYAPDFFNSTQILVLKIFELIVSRQAEIKSMDEDPSHFIQLSDDFSKTQQIQSVKMKSGMFLYNFCLSVDGALTFVVKMCFVAIHYLQVKAVKALKPEIGVRQGLERCDQLFESMMSVWSGTAEQLTETSILILSCISDLLQKRPELLDLVKGHLIIMHILFVNKEAILNYFPTIIIARYIQLFSFFSFAKCLDPFIPYYKLHPVYEESILKGVQTILHFHDKTNESMRNYVSLLSKTVLLLGDKLTKQLEKSIVHRPELILSVKQKIMQKLINWQLHYFENENVFGCNKISNLICIMLTNYHKAIIQTDQQGFNLDLATLSDYLSPLYKTLMKYQAHCAQQSIIDIAVEHIKCLGETIVQSTAKNFLTMAIKVVQNNHYVLNKSLELICSLLCIKNFEKNNQSILFHRRKKIQSQTAKELLPHLMHWITNIEPRQIDIWQLVQLTEFVLLNYQQQNFTATLMNYNRLQQLYHICQHKIVQIKIIMVQMLALKLKPDHSSRPYLFLNQMKLPILIPPYDRKAFAIYLARIVPYFPLPQKQKFLQTLLRIIKPDATYQKFLDKYEDRIHCSTSAQAQTEVFAYQTITSMIHPLYCEGADIFNEFRLMVKSDKDWQNIVMRMNEQERSEFRRIMQQETVGNTSRKIVRIKKNL